VSCPSFSPSRSMIRNRPPTHFAVSGSWVSADRTRDQESRPPRSERGYRLSEIQVAQLNERVLSHVEALPEIRAHTMGTSRRLIF